VTSAGQGSCGWRTSVDVVLDLAGALALLAVVVEQFEVFGLVSGPGVFLEVAVRSPEGGRGPDRDGGNRAARRSITAGEELRSPRVVRWD
jgi:hypothetical protein